jgi:dephospho-CoA kinase
MPNKRGFFLGGVTGGIGSGKSAVCSSFARLGRAVLSADGLARDIMDRDAEVKEQVERLLGKAAYVPEGILDRKFVAARVFTDPVAKDHLDAIVHPAVFREIDKQVSRLSPHEREPYVVIEAALIYESRMEKRLDYVIVVQADEETRIRRVMQREHCTREEVLRRIEAQMPADAKVKRADFVIRNDAGQEQLPSKVRFVDLLLTGLLRSDPPADKKPGELFP